MQLDRTSYSQCRGLPAEWGLEGFALGRTNLVVGRNATGESRGINIIADPAGRFFRGNTGFSHPGEFRVVYSNGADVWDYSFGFDSYKGIKED